MNKKITRHLWNYVRFYDDQKETKDNINKDENWSKLNFYYTEPGKKVNFICNVDKKNCKKKMYIIYCSDSSKVEQYENTFEHVHISEKKTVIDRLIKVEINKMDDQGFKTNKIIIELQNDTFK